MARERLHKVLAAAGLASRRKCEEMIAAGDVEVNGRVAIVGDRVDPVTDVIMVRGWRLTPVSSRLYLALNKPPGYVTSLRSTHGERTVMELVAVPSRVFPVGRLDRDTSGLLLLTDDGDWANIITHPRYGVEKEYSAIVQGRPSVEALRRLRSGVRLPDGTTTSPARVELVQYGGSDTQLSVTVIEGKKRQIRLMAGAVGHPVTRLRRIRVGSIRLADLPEGEWRHLRLDEVKSIGAHEHGAIETVGASPRPSRGN